jgi:hypothetical protein
MRSTILGFALTIASACASGGVRQEPASAMASRGVTIAGSWIHAPDTPQTYAPDWSRSTRQVVQPRFMEPPAPPPAANEDPAWANRQFLVERQAAEDRWAAANRARDASYFAIADVLHQAPAAIHVNVTPAQVILNKDGQRLFFRTSGIKERSTAFLSSVSVRTSWEGASLHQELTNAHGVKVTQVYTPATDGRTMSVVTTVLSPAFRPRLERHAPIGGRNN